MSSMVVGRYRSADVMNPRGGYQEPFAVIAPIFYHKDGQISLLNILISKKMLIQMFMSKCSIFQ
jgi:hypothetical protein